MNSVFFIFSKKKIYLRYHEELSSNVSEKRGFRMVKNEYFNSRCTKLKFRNSIFYTYIE